MRSINLLKIAVEAEPVRLHAWMRRHARPGAYWHGRARPWKK